MMRMRRLVPVGTLVLAIGCSGGAPPTLPTAPGADASSSASATGATFPVSGSVFTFGGAAPAQIAVSAPGGPAVVVDEQGRFELSNVPGQAGFLLIRIDGQELRLTVTPPGQSQVLVLEIRVDLGAGRAEVARRCALSAPPSGQTLPAAAVTALCRG